jgi:hypothetical protein
MAPSNTWYENLFYENTCPHCRYIFAAAFIASSHTASGKKPFGDHHKRDRQPMV